MCFWNTLKVSNRPQFILSIKCLITLTIGIAYLKGAKQTQALWSRSSVVSHTLNAIFCLRLAVSARKRALYIKKYRDTYILDKSKYIYSFIVESLNVKRDHECQLARITLTKGLSCIEVPFQTIAIEFHTHSGAFVSAACASTVGRAFGTTRCTFQFMSKTKIIHILISDNVFLKYFSQEDFT